MEISERDLARYRERIRRHYPRQALARLEPVPEGLVNDVIVVDGELVCRFPKSEQGRELLQREARLLELLRPQLSVAVPHFEVLEPDFVSYRFLPGEPLTRRRLLGMSAAGRERVLAQLGEFLRALHGVSADALAAAEIGPSPAVRSEGDWRALLELVRKVVYPLLYRYQRDEIEALFAPLQAGLMSREVPAAAIHADLAPQHLLYDPASERLTGVLDFGNGGLGDPATDIATLLHQYGERLVWPLEPHYPALAGVIERARFWAGTVDLQWAVAALEGVHRGFMVAHLGTALDLLPVGSGRP